MRVRSGIDGFTFFLHNRTRHTCYRIILILTSCNEEPVIGDHHHVRGRHEGEEKVDYCPKAQAV